jgi:glycosyltransferase involved in cell wall biosynthesis
MRITVVIPAHNEERLIERCLGHIQAAAEAFRDRNWEVERIVCDNHSTDRTAELAGAAGASVVFEPFQQIARARNRGAAAATGDWLVFVDADAFPERPLFDAVARAIESGSVVAGGATVRLEPADLSVRLATHLWNAISRLNRWVAGSFLFCQTAIFRELGGFDESLFASEEIELSRRLKRAARARSKRVVILHRTPLVSSGRKGHLCSPVEYFVLLGRIVWSRGACLRRRDACAIWYDGRR